MKPVVIIAIAVVLMIPLTAFAYPSINLNLNKQEYTTGELIKISGEVTEPHKRTRVNLFIYNPDGEQVLAEELEVRTNGQYGKSLTAGKTTNSVFPVDMIWVNGQYKVNVHYGSTSAKDTSFFEYKKFVEAPKPPPVKHVPKFDMKGIPEWVKNVAKWYGDDLIPDSEFAKSLEFLIKEKIINLSNIPESNSDISQTKIPVWVKSVVKMWADEQIPTTDFLNGLKFLIENGIIKVD